MSLAPRVTKEPPTHLRDSSRGHRGAHEMFETAADGPQATSLPKLPKGYTRAAARCTEDAYVESPPAPAF
eukprot:9481154-Pyramimonas_sp.AAC.1